MATINMTPWGRELKVSELKPGAPVVLVKNEGNVASAMLTQVLEVGDEYVAFMFGPSIFAARIEGDHITDDAHSKLSMHELLIEKAAAFDPAVN